MEFHSSYKIVLDGKEINLNINFDETSEQILQNTVQDLFLLREIPQRVEKNMLDWRAMALFEAMVDDYVSDDSYDKVQDAKDACRDVVLRRMRQDTSIQMSFIKEQALRLAFLGGNLKREAGVFYIVDGETDERHEIQVKPEWFDDSKDNERLLENHMPPKPIRERKNPLEQRIAILNHILSENPGLRAHVVELIKKYFNDATIDAIISARSKRDDSFLA